MYKKIPFPENAKMQVHKEWNRHEICLTIVHGKEDHIVHVVHHIDRFSVRALGYFNDACIRVHFQPLVWIITYLKPVSSHSGF